jgi:O-antigen/teichoic acid export membrane protein
MKKFFEELLRVYKKIPLPAKASMWFVFCSVVQKGIAFITTPIFTRMMSTKEYGLVSVYSSWVSILTVVLTLQLATGVYNKAMIRYEEQRNEYTSSMLFLTTLLISGGLGIFLLFPKQLSNALGMSTSLIIAMFVDLIFSQAMSFWTVRNRFEYEYKDIVGYTIASTFFSTFGSVIAIYLFPEHKAYARIYAMVLVHIVIYSVVYYKIMRTGRKTVWKEAWRYALHYNIPLIPHYLSQQVLNQADRLMINRMCGSAQTAIYTVAYQIAMVLNIVTTAIESSFTPWAYQKISEGKENEVGKIAQSILIVTGITCLFFTLFAPEFIYLLGGNAYQSAIWVVPPVCMSVYFIMMYSLISTVTFYYEKTKSIMLASCAIAVLNIILNQYFITIYGMVAAGYTTLVCYICYALVHYLLMCHVSKDKKRQNPFNIGIIWIPAVLFVFLAVVSSLSYTHLKLRILLMVLLGGLLIFVAYKNKSNLLKLMKK